MALSQTHRDRALALLEERGMVRAREFSEAGVGRWALKRLLEDGAIERVSRGLYSLPGGVRSEYRDLLEVAERTPEAVVCLLSALAFHEIGMQLPHEVWIAIGSKARTPRITHIPIRVVRFSEDALAHGVEGHKVEKMTLRVTSPAKTVADCFKYRNKIGQDVAVEALREGWQDARFALPELRKAAVVCRVENIIRPYVEALV